MAENITQQTVDQEPTFIPPHRGELIRDYSLRDRQNNEVMLSDFRGKANLVLIVWPASPGVAELGLMQSLSNKSSQLKENEARVVVVLPSKVTDQIDSLGDDVLILSDGDGRAVRELGAPAIYVTDKFREVFFTVSGRNSLPTAEEILSWVEFVGMQCPECHPPEWPPV